MQVTRGHEGSRHPRWCPNDRGRAFARRSKIGARRRSSPAGIDDQDLRRTSWEGISGWRSPEANRIGITVIVTEGFGGHLDGGTHLAICSPIKVGRTGERERRHPDQGRRDAARDPRSPRSRARTEERSRSDRWPTRRGCSRSWYHGPRDPRSLTSECWARSRHLPAEPAVLGSGSRGSSARSPSFPDGGTAVVPQGQCRIDRGLDACREHPRITSSDRDSRHAPAGHVRGARERSHGALAAPPAPTDVDRGRICPCGWWRGGEGHLDRARSGSMDSKDSRSGVPGPTVSETVAPA